MLTTNYAQLFCHIKFEFLYCHVCYNNCIFICWKVLLCSNINYQNMLVETVIYFGGHTFEIKSYIYNKNNTNGLLTKFLKLLIRL